jgi:hypothetical protein
LKNQLHVFISYKRTNKKGKKQKSKKDTSTSKNMSMRAAPLFAHFSPPFNNPATFKMEFYTYNLLD